MQLWCGQTRSDRYQTCINGYFMQSAMPVLLIFSMYPHDNVHVEAEHKVDGAPLTQTDNLLY